MNPNFFSDEVKNEARELFKIGHTTTEISKMMGLKTGTVSTWVKDLFDDYNFKCKRISCIQNKYEIRGDVTCIFVIYKGIEMESIIDTEDFERLYRIGCTWYVVKNGTNIYVNGKYIIKKGEKKSLHLHKFILDEQQQNKLDIDHINHNTLDNRKCNLRFLTKAENVQNMKGAHKGNKTGIRGVSIHPYGGYRARLCVNMKNYEKYFTKIEEASEWVYLKRKELMPASNE
jgi:hypothetical protein